MVFNGFRNPLNSNKPDRRRQSVQIQDIPLTIPLIDTTLSIEESKMSLPENIDDKALTEFVLEEIEANNSEEKLPTPPPSPDSKGEKDVPVSVFSLAQVSMKLTELWSTAQERVFGEDYWIPKDIYDVAIFPNEFLKSHEIVYPPHVTENSIPTMRVVQSTAKSDNQENTPLHHVVFSHAGHKETLSLFRTKDLNDALDFCRRCEECRVLFKMLDLGTYKDIRRQVRDLTNKFQAHPLWRMIHIAIACGRTDVFTDDGVEYLKKMGYSDDDLVRVLAQPEGKYPVHLAIEMNQPEMVKSLFRLGADISTVDSEGNNFLHYAALASTQMIEIVWAQPDSNYLLNALNNDRNTPVLLAIRNANPFCLKALLNIGADMSIRIAGKNPLFEAVQSKGKSIDIIRAIIDAQPDLITEVEEATGNTVLHASLYKMPLMGVLNLRREELDLNAKNKSGQAALHLFTGRGDIGQIITIASYGCDMNTRDENGNTALHIAVSKSNLAVTRLLLCLGSNPNLVNKHGDSPRHLASKLHDHNLLKSLIMCNGKRCSHSKTGCVSGCVNQKSLRILPKSSSTQSTQSVQNIKDDHEHQMKSPRSLSKIEELEAPEAMIQQHSWNKYHEFEHTEIYDEMIKRLTEMVRAKEKNRNIINALCLDGGGIRGLVIVQILIEVEYQMQEPIFKYFDWVAGTSTGSLIAAALSLGKTTRDCQMIYLRFKDLIFDGWVRPYKSAILETFIKAEVGEDLLIGDVDWPRLMFTTTRADVFPVQLEFMRNYRLPLSNEENDEFGFYDPNELLLWKACRRSSAAPTYFSSVDNKYIDGGIMANNPTLDFLTEVQTWNTVCKTLKRPTQVEIGCILSIGTGVVPSIAMDASQLDISNNPYSSAVAIKNLGVILVDQVTATEGAPVNRASSWCITKRTPYFRLSAPLHKEVSMDEKDDTVLAKMLWDCTEYTYKQRPYIKKICDLLKKIGPAESRRHLFENPNNQGTQTSRPSSACSNSNKEEYHPTEEVIFKASSSGSEDMSEANDTDNSSKASGSIKNGRPRVNKKQLNEKKNDSKYSPIKASNNDPPKASKTELEDAENCATQNDAPNSKVTTENPGSPTDSKTGIVKAVEEAGEETSKDDNSKKDSSN